MNILDESQEIRTSIKKNAPSTHLDIIFYKSKNRKQQNSESQTSLPKIIVGDFSQFSKEFPLPQHQCTAMATVALATASFKNVK